MSSWEKNAAQEFDQWQRKGRADGMAVGHRHGTEGILQQWQFGPDSRVLDVGCGQGWLVRHICEQGISLGVGVDISEEMIKHAQQFSGLNSQYLVSSASILPFESGFFSHVISIESLYYHTDPAVSLLEWHRVSKAGGKLGIMVDLYKENHGSHAWVDALNIPVHLLSIAEYIELLESKSSQFKWGIMWAAEVKEFYGYAKENNLFKNVRYMGNKSAVILKQEDFSKWFIEENWHETIQT